MLAIQTTSSSSAAFIARTTASFSTSSSCSCSSSSSRRRSPSVVVMASTSCRGRTLHDANAMKTTTPLKLGRKRERRNGIVIGVGAIGGEDDETIDDFERPPPPPGPENDAMESETFSTALKAGFVVLSVLSVVAVFSLAAPVLQIMTETFPAGRGPQ